MIAPEQLAAALGRLDPRDWEILDLSLRRRVPDEALGEVLGADPAEVARRRATAIERLADDLGVQRGEDLGAMLKALLEAETWEAAEAGGPAPAPRRASAPRKEPLPTGTAGAPQATAGAAPTAPAPPPETPTAGDGHDGTPPRREPVLEMLSPDGKPQRRRRLARVALTTAAGALLLVGGGAAAALLVGDGTGDESTTEGGGTKVFVPQSSGSLGAPFPSDPNVAFRYPTALVRKATVLYDRPGGRRKLRIASRTEWRSPRVLSVVRQRGPWLAVLVPELGNGEVGWLPEHKARLGSVSWSVHADLSRRRLRIRKDGDTVRRFRVAVGRQSNPTPTGRFAVTDRLRVSDGPSVYGCCVLALTGHQTRLPRTWPGGDRLAIHATTNVASIGQPVSLGCLRLTSPQARWLIRNVPLGTPVFIRR